MFSPFLLWTPVDGTTHWFLSSSAAYNVTINDQWPAEGFDHNGAYPIFIEEIPAYALCILFPIP